VTLELPVVPTPSASCARCGDCCRNIWTAAGPAFLEGETPEGEAAAANHAFMRAHWKLEETREAGDGREWETFRYTCDAFDEATSSCTAYDTRPPICSGHPYYDRALGELEPSSLLSKRCSFWADIPRELWPEDVDPLPSPVAA
jgi:Fe-S-cluster containining protein